MPSIPRQRFGKQHGAMSLALIGFRSTGRPKHVPCGKLNQSGYGVGPYWVISSHGCGLTPRRRPTRNSDSYP